MLSESQREKIRGSFQKGTLRVQSVSPGGEPVWKRLAHVLRNEVPWERIVEVSTPKGSATFTWGHRLFTAPTEKAEAGELRPGQTLLSVLEDGSVFYLPVTGVRELPARQFMYDLTAEDHHNFLALGVHAIVSNCPDKYYHFRPPEWEGNIGQYNRVFGQIWEDAELYEYLERGLDWWNMFPPLTESLNTLDKLCAEKPVWRTAIMWSAISHACFALAANWVADEFDYSIGGVSLSSEKSSKYESLKSNAEGQFDKATEAKARTGKFIRGLQQPKYGIGIRSAFGPHVGRGVLSPRNFL